MYDRNLVVTELTSYYQFLTTMYLPEDVIRYPPARGWPGVTKERLAFLGKDDAVIDLLRHLPYLVDNGSQPGSVHQGYDMFTDARCNDYGGGAFQHDQVDHFGQYTYASCVRRKDKDAVEGPREDIPSYVATIGRVTIRDGHSIFLDTRDGSVELYMMYNGRSRYFDNMADFCEFAKGEFRALRAVPESPSRVVPDQLRGQSPGRAARIFAKHGWPTNDYDKSACMEEIENDDEIVP